MLQVIPKQLQGSQEPTEPKTKNSVALENLQGNFSKRSKLLGLWIFLCLNLGVLSLSFLLQLLNLVHIGRVANKPAAVLVENSNGTGSLVSAIPASQRTPKALQRFTSDLLTAMFQVSPVVEGKGAAKNGIKVPNLEGGSSNKVTVNAYTAVLAGVSPQFRDSFLTKLAGITPQTAFSGGQTQVIFKIEFLGEPLPVEGEEGKWTVTVVANRYLIDENPDSLRSLKPEQFKQTIYLESVPPQYSPLQGVNTQIQQDIARITEIGLRIYKMVPINATTPQGGDFLELPNQLNQETQENE